MPKLTTGQLRAKAARYLRAEGHSLSEIGAALDVSKTQKPLFTGVFKSSGPLTASTLEAAMRSLDGALATDVASFEINYYITHLNLRRPVNDTLVAEVVGISDTHGLTEHYLICNERGEAVFCEYSEAELLTAMRAALNAGRRY